jgi:hypothetical protein
MDSVVKSPNQLPSLSTGKTPRKETYYKAFDELILVLFKEYRKTIQAKATEPNEQII